MAKKLVTLIFPQHLIKEPVIYTMAKECEVIPNIQKARVSEEIGEVTLEIEGSEEHVKKAIEFLDKKGVKIETA
jgi:ABC-type methionine transport system ATPase subunit